MDIVGKRLNIKHTIIKHSEQSSFQDWCAVLRENNVIPTKTLVLKSSKSDVPILVISLDSTQFSIGQLAKYIGFKDARVATDAFVLDFFKIDKINLTPFSAQSNVLVVVDELVFKQDLIGFRLFSGLESAAVAPDLLDTFLKSACPEHQVLDFSLLGNSTIKAEPIEAKKDENAPLIGITAKKDVDFSNWYTQVVQRSEMLDYYDISGCYIIRPWAFSVWKQIQNFFGSSIEELGVEDCYFPMFVSERSLNKEKDHVEGFSPEVAWVTRAGQSDLAEPIAVRPTSETVMYPYYSNWIRSHRDLPLRLNQWCNVVRWEFKHAQPFLRTREFLWQEGHTAFATKEESDKEVRDILDLYRRVYEELLAVPVIPGVKSEKEKFAGGLYTTTVEGFIPTTGRAIQGATSHSLGQNFSKMFNIMIDEGNTRSHVWQNSWGLTTRTIGVMVMIHGDDKGLVLPPKVASVQVIVIPVGLAAKTSKEQKDKIFDKAQELVVNLKKAGIRAKADLRDNYSPGFKYNHWELKGVPIRLEVGPKDVAKEEARCVRRDDGSSKQLSTKTIVEDISSMLETIQQDMFAKAKKTRDERIVRVDKWDGFVEALNNKCMVLAPWCERVACEEHVKEKSATSDVVDERAPSMGAKTMCIPFQQEKMTATKCFACDQAPIRYAMWGRSY